MVYEELIVLERGRLESNVQLSDIFQLYKYTCAV